MIWFLRILFSAIFLTMIWVTTRASLHQGLGDFAASPVFRDPWVVATLCDAYFAFIPFYLWTAWKEQSISARLLWFFAVFLLGNLAIAIYMLRELCTISANTPLGEIVTRRNPGHWLLPGILTAISVVVYYLA